MKVKNSAKLVFLLISVIIGTSFLMPVSPVFAQTAASNAALIQSLQAQIAALMAKTQQLQASQGQAQPGAGILLPVRSTPPVIDGDFDDIVQFNNLIVRSVSGPSFPAEIKASYEVGVRCQKFQSESAGGIEYPCPLSPSVLYTIRVDSDTRLLLRNRIRATLRDFEVGNRINVYGFTNSGVSSIDALVVRNLTKPVRLSFVQLNNMEALSAPSSGVSSATFTVVNRYFSPCRDFSDGPNSGVTLPCPLGLEIMEQPQQSTNVSGGSSGASPAYYPIPRKYLIEVTSQTTILQRDRTSMALSDIVVGDILNIYGSYTNSSQNIQAIVIRDLSKPAQNYGSLQVSVNNANVMCILSQSSSQSVQSGGGGGGGGEGLLGEPTIVAPIVTPCGTIYGAQVDLYDVSGTLVGTQTTERGAAFFENLRAGEYTIVAGAKGYDKNKTNVSIGAGRVTFATIYLLQFEVFPPLPGPTPFPTPPPINNQTPVISGVKGPTALKVGETGTWGVSAYDPENGQLFYLVMWGDENPGTGSGGGSGSPMPLKAEISQTATFTHSYANAGVYTPVFYVTDNQGLSAKTSLSVNVGNSQTNLGSLYLSPSSLSVGVGQSAEIKAFYQPPMPPCPAGMVCTMAMPAPYPVETLWTASNYAVVKLIGLNSKVCAMADICATSEISVTGITSGTAEIKASFTQYPNSYTAKATVEVKPVSLQPSITVLSPNGGEQWQIGSTQTIRWQPYKSPPCITAPCLNVIPAPVTIEIQNTSPSSSCVDPGPCYPFDAISYVIASNIIDSGSFNWTVGKTINMGDLGSEKYLITVNNGVNSDSSDAPFSIVSSSALSIVTSSLPNGTVGVAYSTQINSSGASSDAKWNMSSGTVPHGLNFLTTPIPCSTQLGSSGVCFAPSGYISGTPTTAGTYTFTVSVTSGGQSASKQFTITINAVSSQPSITVLSPNGGETYRTGDTVNIKWNSTGLSSNDILKIELGYYQNDPTYPGGSYIEEWIVVQTPNTGSYAWKIPEAYGLGLKESGFRIKINSGPIVDYSDNNFTIKMGVSSPTLNVSSPIGGSIYQAGSVVPIKWSPYDSSQSVRFGLLKKSDTAFLRWINGVGVGAGDWQWTVPTGLSGNDYYVRVETHNNAIPSGIGYSGVFSIGATSQPSITVVSPNGGEQWQVGSSQTVRWNSSNVSTTGYVNIVLINQSTAQTYSFWNGYENDGMQVASVSSIPTGSYVVKVEALTGDKFISDQSDAPFSIVGAMQSSYPGFFIKLDKSTYAPTDTLVLTSSRADGKTAYYPVDIYAVRNRDNVRTLIQASASIALNTNTYIFLDRWPIFQSGGVGGYLILFCDASKECVSGVNTNSVGFSIVAASSGGGGGGSGTGSTTGALAPNSSQTASMLDAIKPIWWPSGF